MKVEIQQMLNALKKLGEKKDCTYDIVIHEDGSGSINEYHTEQAIFFFQNIDDLLKILDVKVVKGLPRYTVNKSDYDWLQMNRPLDLPGR